MRTKEIFWMSFALFLCLPAKGQQPGAVTVNFSNLSNQPVQLARIPATVLAQPATAFAGAATPLGVLPAGNRVSISSFPGDVWTATSNSRVVAQFRTTSDPRQVFSITQAQVGSAQIPTGPAVQPGSGSKLDNFLRNASRVLEQVAPQNVPQNTVVTPTQPTPAQPVPVPAPAAPAMPNQGAPATVTISNFSASAVTVTFINESNQLQSVGQIPPQQAAPLSSQVGQRLVFLDSGNQSVGSYIVTNSPGQTYSIGGPATTAPAATAPNAPTLGNRFPPTQNQPTPATTAPSAAQSSLPAGGTGSNVPVADARAMLAYHNEKRREVGTAPVTWSADIARYAQTRADTIARTKRFSHLPQGQNPYGENLASGGSTGGASGYSALKGAEDWYKEKQLMPAGARVLDNALFSRGVGHYTQMVWKGSTQIGAGIATYQQNGFTMTVVVCCYNPPGNVLNQPIY